MKYRKLIPDYQRDYHYQNHYRDEHITIIADDYFDLDTEPKVEEYIRKTIIHDNLGMNHEYFYLKSWSGYSSNIDIVYGLKKEDNLFYMNDLNIKLQIVKHIFVPSLPDSRIRYQALSQRLGNQIKKIGFDKDYTNEHIYTVIAKFRDNVNNLEWEAESEPVRFGHVPGIREYNKIVPFINNRGVYGWNYDNVGGRWTCPDIRYIADFEVEAINERDLPMYMETKFVYQIYAKLGQIEKPYTGERNNVRPIDKKVKGGLIYLDHPFNNEDKKVIRARVDNQEKVTWDYGDIKIYKPFVPPMSVKYLGTEKVDRAQDAGGIYRDTSQLPVYRNQYEFVNNIAKDVSTIYSEPFTFDRVPEVSDSELRDHGFNPYGKYLSMDVSYDAEFALDYKGCKVFNRRDITNNDNKVVRNLQYIRVTYIGNYPVKDQHVYKAICYVNTNPDRDNVEAYRAVESGLVMFDHSPTIQELRRCFVFTDKPNETKWDLTTDAVPYQYPEEVLGHYGIEATVIKFGGTNDYVFCYKVTSFFIRNRVKVYKTTVYSPAVWNQSGRPTDAELKQNLRAELIDVAGKCSVTVSNFPNYTGWWNQDKTEVLKFDHRPFTELNIPD